MQTRNKTAHAAAITITAKNISEKPPGKIMNTYVHTSGRNGNIDSVYWMQKSENVQCSLDLKIYYASQCHSGRSLDDTIN